MILQIHNQNPEPRKIAQIVDILNNDGVIIYPTDSVYALGCSINSKPAFEKLCNLKGLDPTKAMFSMLCKNISQVSEYSRQISNDNFRILKRNLPGPFTFILNAGNNLPKTLYNRKETIGVRIPENKIILSIIEEMGHPLLSTSLKNESDEILEYYTEIEDINQSYEKQVDCIINGGKGHLTPSALVDLTGEVPEIIREGVRQLE